MVRQPAAAAAAEAARSLRTLSLGLHVDIAQWELSGGVWETVYAWADPSDEAAVTHEVAEQMALFQELVGEAPTHLDSHQHAHRDEPLRSILARAARTLRVPLRHYSPVRYEGGFYGRGRSNQRLPTAVGWENLVRLISELPNGVTELCCHPAKSVASGWSYGLERTQELSALCDRRPRAALAENTVQLISFRDVSRLLPARQVRRRRADGPLAPN
jgi:predicted glycoside hydrolase/deacetylase ChbG (UPF0249 family)